MAWHTDHDQQRPLRRRTVAPRDHPAVVHLLPCGVDGGAHHHVGVQIEAEQQAAQQHCVVGHIAWGSSQAGRVNHSAPGEAATRVGDTTHLLAAIRTCSSSATPRHARQRPRTARGGLEAGSRTEPRGAVCPTAGLLAWARRTCVADSEDTDTHVSHATRECAA